MSVEHLEDRVGRLEGHMSNVLTTVENMAGQVSRLVDGISKIDSTAQREARSVQTEIREERQRERSAGNELLKNALATVGIVMAVVGAFGGPYLNKVNATETKADTAMEQVGKLRESLAEQGPNIARDHDQIDQIVERNRVRDQQIQVLNNDAAFRRGWMAAKFNYPGGAQP